MKDIKPNSCNTCALKVSLSQTDEASDIRVEEVYAEFRRRNKYSRRSLDVGGDDAKTAFCALGSRHFKKGGGNCFQWVPDIGLSIAEALSVNLNKKIFWLTIITIILAFLSLIGTFMPLITPQPVHQCVGIIAKSLPTQRNYGGEGQPNQEERGDKKEKNTPNDNLILEGNIIKQREKVKNTLPQKYKYPLHY